MADTVKKSRIVSEENFSNFDVLTEDGDSLQAIINSEFNERLKNCMTPNLTVLNEPPDLPPTNNTITNTNGFNCNNSNCNNSDSSKQFIEHEIAAELRNNQYEIENKEVPSPERPNLIQESPESPASITVTDVDDDNLTAKDRFLSTLEAENKTSATVKDRMFLSTDSACLLFTQTVLQSPMLTPTDENYDFVEALKLKDVSAEVIDSSNSENDLSDSQQMDEIKQDIKEFVNENLLEAPQENSQQILQELNNEINNCDGTDDEGDVTSESTTTYVETRTEMNSSGEKGLKKKKSKKAKKDSEKENISVKSSFSKFDALSKKTVLHVRSSDAGKAQEKFNGNNQIDTSLCKSCQKQVFQMEQIKAEKAIWHKNCFRCKECNKQLNVDTYQSNEGVVYCKPHFKALFSPKAVEDEPQPTSDKPDLGLEELQNLNVKERFQVFEHHETAEGNSLERSPSNVNVKRSPSILSKLAKFQQKGMDIGVADDSLNGVPLEESASEAEDDDDDIDGTEDPNLVRARRAAAQREIPLHFNNMSEVMSKWESGNQMSKEERREERKQEIQSIRSRLFMGKQGKMKEMYQQAVAESESGVNVKKSTPLDTDVCEGAKSLKDKFERGEALTHDEEQKLRELEEDKGVFESGISKKSRSIFLELDANASKAPHLAPLSPSKSGTEVRRAREVPSPERDVYRDPDIIRSDDLNEDDSLLAKKTHTATKMLNIFRQMEENLQKKEEPLGPKPLKRFTPPPEGETQRHCSDSEETQSETEDECDEDDHEPKVIDEDLIEAQKAARAKQLRAKFEKWEAHELQREQNNSSVNLAQEIGEGESQIESARSLRARFESMRETTTEKERQPRIKVNRFVDQTNSAEICKSCQGRVYPLEKISCHNNIYHKNCFRCKECNTILRMDSYSYNQGLLYCLPHFKRLFAVKGNYESGFGLDQHKEKWNITA